ncbi:MAG TPA: glycosyltransferase [Burkholderiales bacterium]|jgi:glycosyltransferase involved in cell wall biosynthesis
MRISVVVPAYNEERLLHGTLRSIGAAMEAFDRRGWTSELIVCDNNSTDRTASIAREAGARVVFEPVNQISRARNRGAAEAGGDWIFFVDADSQPTVALFSEAADAIAAGRCLAGGCTVTYANPPRGVALAVGMWNALSRVTRWAAGSFIFCEATAFRETGGFSEELYASEEVDLFRRLKRMARRNWRTIVILHRHPLLTSDRKLRLYSWGELSRFALKTIVSRGKTLRRRQDCFAWYDGKR